MLAHQEVMPFDITRHL